MRNSICMLSFPISHIVFLQKKMYVVLIGLGVCFFAKHVHVLVKDFKTIRVFCQDYQSLLYFSKTIKVCCLAETINVFCPLLFKDYQSMLSCGDYQCLLPFTFPKTIRVFCQRLSKSSLHFQRLQCLLSRLSKSSLRFQRLQCLLSRLSKSSLLFQDYQSPLLRLQCLLYFFFKKRGYQCILSRLQCLLYILKTSTSFVWCT